MATAMTIATTEMKSGVGIILVPLEFPLPDSTLAEAVLSRAWSTRWVNEPVEPLKEAERRLKYPKVRGCIPDSCTETGLLALMLAGASSLMSLSALISAISTEPWVVRRSQMRRAPFVGFKG